MTFPAYLARLISYRQNESAGNEIPTAVLDAEFNNVEEIVNQLNRRVRGITNVAGQLINVAAQIAQALVGTQRFAPGGATTVFTTTITWDSSFSNGNVLVNANGLMIDPNTVTVSNSGGFLRVTLGTAVSSGWVDVAAYSQGAGILTRLNSTANGDGASLIGIEDVGGLYSAVEVEGALQEVATEVADLLATLGTLSKIWTSDGTTVSGDPASADFDMGGFKVKNLADGVANTDAVTLQQLLAVTQNLDTLLSLFVRVDGINAFTGNQSMGGHRLTDLGTAIANGDAVTFFQLNNIDGAQIVSGTIPGIRLGVFGGATALANGTVGAVPAPVIADFTGDKFLSADGSFKAVPSNLGGFIVLQDQKATTVQGGTAVATTWTARVLNTEVVDTGGNCALAANQFTLSAPSYPASFRIDASAPFFRVDRCAIRLRDITNAATVLTGMATFSNNSADFTVAVSRLLGRFTIAAPTVFEIQYYCQAGRATNGLGVDSGTGDTENYTTVELIRE